MSSFALPDLETKEMVRTAASWGRLHLDRPLPWIGLCPVPHQIATTDRTLIEGWPAYLAYYQGAFSKAGPKSELWGEAREVLRHIIRERTRAFGAFLVVELTVREERQGAVTVRVRGRSPCRQVIDALSSGLNAITELGDVPEMQVREETDSTTPLSPEELPSAYWLTIDLDPIYFDPATGCSYPLVGRSLAIALDSTVRECWCEFARHHTTFQVRTPAEAGRRNLLRSEWSTDRALAKINESYDFLLNITPVNAVEAWHEFSESRFERAPRLRYRPVNVDPEALRRTLFQIPIHQTEDPTLAQLFRAEQEGIDQKLRMLEQRDTPRFVLDSLHLYGAVDENLLSSAQELLETLDHDHPSHRESTIDAHTFAAVAVERISKYRQELPLVSSRVEVRSDIASVMVAGGNLLIPETTRCAHSRIEGLLAHEVGTHIVTYFNGRAQRLQLLAAGLSGADELQEGLAVLAEALTGSLTPERLRLLAGRVLAVHRLIQGADFVEVYRELNREYSFSKRHAFGIALRAFRAGGFTKDAIYLRGLKGVLEYLARGEPLELLLVGKLAFSHVPLIQQLLEREIIGPPALIPHYLRHDDGKRRLEQLKRGQPLKCLLHRRAA